MSTFPTIACDFSELSNMFFGAVKSRLLLTAVDLGVFDHLETPLTSERLADILSCHPGNTALMLDALVALGLVRKNGGTYNNQPLAGEFLVRGKPVYLGRWLQLTNESWVDCLRQLPDLIRSGPPAVSPGAHMNTEEACERFTAAHAATSLAGIARGIADLIATLPGFAEHRRMLDLGGGPGINAMAVIERHEVLRAVVLDRPEIVDMARRYAGQYGFLERIEFIGGDYFTSAMEPGYDLIMATDTLYYDAHEIDSVIERCARALVPGGMLVTIHAVLTHDRTQPEQMVLGMLPEALAGQASLPDKGFLVHAMESRGFREVTSRMVVVAGNPMEMNTGVIPCRTDTGSSLNS